MIAVIFEVWPKPGHKQRYLDLAAELRPLLDQIDGFISIERFESLTEKGKFVSLSFFRDEAAVEAWRNTVEHRRRQPQLRREPEQKRRRKGDSRDDDEPGEVKIGHARTLSREPPRRFGADASSDRGV